MPQEHAAASAPPPGAGEVAYARWRAAKLAEAPRDMAAVTVTLEDVSRPADQELEALQACCRRANLVRFRSRRLPERPAQALQSLCTALGLTRLDRNLCAEPSGISALTVDGDARGAYVPYTNRPLSWHTDGYYNPPERTVRAFVLHCVRPAAEGGESLLMDHELAYIDLRDEDPALVEALMAPDAMTIPPNEAPEAARGACAGPVLWVEDGRLRLRYTARARNVVWKDDPLVRAAAERLRTLPERRPEWVLRRRLRPGETLVTNNVLHARTGFRDGADGGRLLYRARYHDPIDTAGETAGTEGELPRCSGSASC